MTLSLWDWLVAAGFFAVVVGLGLAKRAREADTATYFLAGRGLPWWIIGVSIVAANISTEQFVGMAGQSAGDVGLAVVNWQLMGSVAVVFIAWLLLPRFLRAGICTMPEFLEYRYNAVARSIMAALTVLIYVGVLLTAVLYSGALTLRAVFDVPLTTGVWAVAAVASVYTIWGGLRSVAWADLLQGLALLVGGLLLFALGLHACGGWSALVAGQGARLHMVLPADHPRLPWTGVVAGMWIVELYYCGLNQFIVQRSLAARSLRDGQLGVIAAGALWLIVPFAVVLPGVIAVQLFGAELARPDEAFPMLVRRLVPVGIRGFMLAAIAGAVVSSLASMMNSAATIATMDLYHRWLDCRAPPRRLVMVGRVWTLVFVAVAAWLAPRLDDPRWGGVFQYIQQFQGYIWGGVAAVFIYGLLVPTAPPAAGVAGLLVGPALYAVFQRWAPNLHFLVQVALVFQLVLLVMGAITLWRPLPEPRLLPVRRELEARTAPVVHAAGVAVLLGVALFYAVFW